MREHGGSTAGETGIVDLGPLVTVQTRTAHRLIDINFNFIRVSGFPSSDRHGYPGRRSFIFDLSLTLRGACCVRRGMETRVTM